MLETQPRFTPGRHARSNSTCDLKNSRFPFFTKFHSKYSSQEPLYSRTKMWAPVYELRHPFYENGGRGTGMRYKRNNYYFIQVLEQVFYFIFTEFVCLSALQDPKTF